MQVKLFIFVSAAFTGVLSKCLPQKVNFLNFPKRPKRSIPFILEVEAEKCPGEQKFYYKWEVQEGIRGPIVITGSEASLFIDGYNFSTSKVFSNQYIITAYVTHEPEIFEAHTKNSLLFAPDSMHLQIKGGTHKTHAANTDLEVDAKTLSRDKSFPPNEDPFENANIKWFQGPYIPLNPDGLLLVVPAKHMVEDKVFNFTVVVERTQIPPHREVKYVSQVVQVVGKNTPVINIKCVLNCVNPHPKESTLLEVVGDEKNKKIFYNWTVTPEVPPGRIEFGTGHDKILIHPNGFNMSDLATFRVQSGKAWSSQTLKFIDPMRSGGCSINPKAGISGQTKFVVSCVGFTSPSGLTRFMIYQLAEDSSSVMLNEDLNQAKSEVYLSEGSPARVIVKIRDGVNAQEDVMVTADVKPFTSSKNDTLNIHAIKAGVLKDDDDSVLTLAREKSRNKLIQTISYLLDALNNSMANETITKDLHMHIAESLYKVTPLNFPSSSQTVSVLLKLEKYRIKTDTETAQFMGKALFNAVMSLHLNIDHNNVPLPYFLLEDFGYDVYKLCSLLIDVYKDVEEILDLETVVHDYDSYDDYKSDKVKIRADMRDLTENIMTTIKTMGTCLLRQNIPEQSPIYYQTDVFLFLTQRVKPLSLVDRRITVYNLTHSWVTLPTPLLNDLHKKHNFIDYQFAVFRKNPFWWHPNVSHYPTDVIHFELLVKCQKIKTLSHPLELNLFINSVPQGSFKGTIKKSDLGLSVHRIIVEGNDTLLVQFDPVSVDIKVSSSSFLCGPKDLAKSYTIKSSSNYDQRNMLIPAFPIRNVVYLCLMSNTSDVSYTGKFFSTSCVYWNLMVGNWQSDGCQIAKILEGNSSYMICKCHHTSFFSGGLFVPPNKINLSEITDFSLVLVQNWLMVLIVTSIWVVWIVFLILARLKDKEMLQSNYVCKLEDNVPGDTHYYLIVVFTGLFIDAGTTADVAFQIIGQNSRSRVHLIRSSCVKMLQRNAQDWFTVCTPFELGEIKKIRIWHNCKGNKPHWYCKRIIIQHLKSGNQWCFIVEKWFSLIWGRGKIYHELRPKKESQLRTMKFLILVKLETSLKDRHLWLSAITRDPQSNFTCMERISCAFCALFLTMLANALFYGIPRGTPADMIDEKPFFYISFTEVGVTVQSFLITFPASFFIIFLFRNASPSGIKYHPAPRVEIGDDPQENAKEKKKKLKMDKLGGIGKFVE